MAKDNLTPVELVGLRIKEIRKKRGMSQAELAAKADISLPHISEIELGKSSMRLSSFIRIVEALNVSSDYLLRANVQEVNNIYQTEFTEILADCTPTELDSILKIVKELKTTMHNKIEA